MESTTIDLVKRDKIEFGRLCYRHPVMHFLLLFLMNLGIFHIFEDVFRSHDHFLGYSMALVFTFTYFTGMRKMTKRRIDREARQAAIS
jgi:hypothetical protein